MPVTYFLTCSKLLGSDKQGKFHAIDLHIHERLQDIQYKLHEQALTELKSIYGNNVKQPAASFLSTLSREHDLTWMRKVIGTSIVCSLPYYLSGLYASSNSITASTVFDIIDEVLVKLIPAFYLIGDINAETVYVKQCLATDYIPSIDHPLYLEFSIPVFEAYQLSSLTDVHFTDAVCKYSDLYPAARWYLTNLNPELSQLSPLRLTLSKSVLYFLTGKLQWELMK